MSHLEAFQAAADDNATDETGPIRTSGTPGYDASVDYVVQQLRDAGLTVERQAFEFPFFEELSDPALEQVSPTPMMYVPEEDFSTMTFSPPGDVTALVEPVDLVLPPAAEANTSTSGCEASDFDAFVPGNIALIQRGNCSFFLKAENAEAAGAVGVIIFNEGQDGRQDAINGTLGSPDIGIPVVGASFAVGEDILFADAMVRIMVDSVSELRLTENVIAETISGRRDRVVVVGAHLDSVPEGPGIQDNGSGSATILEIALQMQALGIQPRNKVRFAFWGAEEFGLLGSEYYVEQLSTREILDISLNLNLDMVASPNFVRFVYDGDGSDTPDAGPAGSDKIENVYLDYFAEQGLPVEPTAFDGRSDYGPFIEVGIPAGGLFTGAEGLKTEEQAIVYGGNEGEQYDPCYHLACDDIGNITANGLIALDQNSDAAAHSVFHYAMLEAALSPDRRDDLRETERDARADGREISREARDAEREAEREARRRDREMRMEFRGNRRQM